MVNLLLIFIGLCLVLLVYSSYITYLFLKERPKKYIKKKEKSMPLFKEVELISGSLQAFTKSLIELSLIGVIIGRRGSGKTALALRIAEYLKDYKEIYSMGISHTPKWIKQVDDIKQVKNNSLLIIDEAALLLEARGSMRKINREISKLMAISRHKDLSLIIITQNSAMIDINALRLVDFLIIKMPSLLQFSMERSQLKKIIEKAKKYLESYKGVQYSYIISDHFEGVVSSSLPSFWEEKISKSMSGV